MTMRYLPDVLAQILAVAPDLHEHLKSVKSSAEFAAPEVQPSWWHEAAMKLEAHASNHPKKEQIARIFAGTEPEPEVAVDPKFKLMMGNIVKSAGVEDPNPEKMGKVLLHNDPQTPNGLVVQILETVFGLDTAPARTLMYQVHRENRPGLVVSLSQFDAEKKISEASVISEGHPLRFTWEQD